MRILRKKNISEKAPADVKIEPAQAELEPVIDHTTANTIASKEANEKAAEKNIETSGILEAADEVIKSIQDPAKKTKAPKTPTLKPYTEAKQVVNRKELANLIRECTKANRVFKVKKSLEEGYRYVFEEFVDDYPECYFVCHSDDDANNENGYFDTLDDAKEYALEHPEICCIFKVCDDEEEKVWVKDESVDECAQKEVCKDCEEKEPLEEKSDLTVLANNRAQVMANDNNKPVIYGFTKNGKFTEVAPIVCDDLEKETNNVKIENADLTVYVAYPGKDIVEAKQAEKVFTDDEAWEYLKDHGIHIDGEAGDDPDTWWEAGFVRQMLDNMQDSDNKDEYEFTETMLKKVIDAVERERQDLRSAEGLDYDTAIEYLDDHDINTDPCTYEGDYVCNELDFLDTNDYGNYNEADLKELINNVIEWRKENPDADEEIDDDEYDEENESLDATKNSNAKRQLTPEEKKRFKKVLNLNKEKTDNLKEAIVAPENDGFGVDDKEEATVTAEAEETNVEEPAEPVEAEEKELAVEENPDAEIEIDSVETYEPTDEVCKKTFTTIKDAGDGAMFAFKDTLKDLYNLKIKVSDLQELLSSSSDWLLDLLGFNENHEEEIHSEEIPETSAEIEEPEIVGGEFDDVEPITDVSNIDINAFDEVEPIVVEDEDEKFFVKD